MRMILRSARDRRLLTGFTQISATALLKFFAPQMRRLFEGHIYLKIGRDK